MENAGAIAKRVLNDRNSSDDAKIIAGFVLAQVPPKRKKKVKKRRRKIVKRRKRKPKQETTPEAA